MILVVVMFSDHLLFAMTMLAASVAVCRCRRGATIGSQYSTQTSMTSPADYTPQVDQSQSPLYALTDELNSLSNSMSTGHVIDDSLQDGYDSADRGHLNGRSIPEQEMGEKNWNENENSMSGASRWLETRDDQNLCSTFPADLEAQAGVSAVEDVSQTSAVCPPPPPPLPAPLLTPVPSTNVASRTQTYPVKVLAV